MKRSLTAALALAIALASAGVAAAVPNEQTITGAFLPKKLPKDKRAPISLFTNVAATNPGNPYQLANPTVLAKVDYDKAGAFQQKGFPTCPDQGGDPREMFGAATKTEDVRQACPDAIVGSGGATVKVPTGPATPPLEVHADVIAANVDQNRILLHSYNPLSGGQPLLGKIGKADPEAGPKYGLTLTVEVPPLAGGTAVITQFDAKIKAVYRFKGKKRSLLSARCPSSKRLGAQARFTDNQGQLAVGTFTQKCKQKKSKKKR
jgi:hypothetical protein